MDEVHRLKDPKAQVTVAAKALDVKRRWARITFIVVMSRIFVTLANAILGDFSR